MCPIIPTLFLILLASHYSQNYTGILDSPLYVYIFRHIKNVCGSEILLVAIVTT